MGTILFVDSGCDLSIDFLNNNNIKFVPLAFEFEGQEYKDDFGKTMGYKEFYDKLREGVVSKTSQINIYNYYEEFKAYIEKGHSIIYIGLSSGLSGSAANAVMAKNQIEEDFKDADISVVDSMGASMGIGLLAYYASEMLNKGIAKNDVVLWLEENKLRLNHWFTVEDLNHLKRGGRISPTAAALGTLLNIKPILNVNNEGKLIPVEKVKGRKKALKTLVEKLTENVIDVEQQVIAISHGDCIEEAEHVKELILQRFNVKNIIINNIGPVIGSHSGPGTVALFFLGNKR
ncbi:MAG: DegV family protein [Bacillota bacterium]|nr:DegV family protein [Bacillota bacterium]